MSDIPSDIMKAASKAYMSQLEQRETAITAGEHKAVCIDEIAKAIYEERKRGAKIADDEADRLLSNEEGYPADRTHDFLVVARRISKAILSGETKD